MMQRLIYPILICLFVAGSGFAAGKNGFDLSNSSIPENEILHGGPPKDGIPAIDNPKFTKSKPPPGTRILGIVVNNVAKAYPINILNWHEIVNDSVGGTKFVISFCPLCGSGMAFSSNVNGKNLSFGVSGLLFNSDVLLYDRETHSLWSQIESEAISGKFKGKKLTDLNVQNTTWEHWVSQYPNSLLLSQDTGYSRNYARNPYTGYQKVETTYFPVKFRALGIHPKEIVVAVKLNGKAKAWPLVELSKYGKDLQDNLGRQPLIVKFDAKSNSARVFHKNGKEINSVTLYWFAWSAFNPETDVFKAN